jgi:hypothetical protein
MATPTGGKRVWDPEDRAWIWDYTGQYESGDTLQTATGGAPPPSGGGLTPRPPANRPPSGTPSGGGGGGGMPSGWQQTQVAPPQGGLVGGNQLPQGMQPPNMGDMLKSGAVGAGTAFGLLGTGIGNAIPAFLGGPAGIGLAAGLGVLGLLGKKKKDSWNPQYLGDREIKTGKYGGYDSSLPAVDQSGRGHYQAVGGAMTENVIASKQEWVQKGQNWTGGAGGSRLNEADYQNYVEKSQRALSEGDYEYLNELRMMHGFNPYQPTAPVHHGGGGRARSATTTDTGPAPSAPKEEISPPASGLEDTIKGGKVPPSYLYPERTKRTFLGGIRAEDEDTGRGSWLTRAG